MRVVDLNAHRLLLMLIIILLMMNGKLKYTAATAKEMNQRRFFWRRWWACLALSYLEGGICVDGVARRWRAGGW